MGILWTQSQTQDDNSGPFRIVTRTWRDSHRGEPDALTAHVRFWEGAVLNCAWLPYCDTTPGNQVDNRENKP